MIVTPACQVGLDWYKTSAIAATFHQNSLLAGSCDHYSRFHLKGKNSPMVLSSVPIFQKIHPSLPPQSLTSSNLGSRNARHSSHLFHHEIPSKQHLTPGPHITDGSGNQGSTNWTVHVSTTQRWTKRVFNMNLHRSFATTCANNQHTPFIEEIDLLHL